MLYTAYNRVNLDDKNKESFSLNQAPCDDKMPESIDYYSLESSK